MISRDARSISDGVEVRAVRNVKRSEVILFPDSSVPVSRKKYELSGERLSRISLCRRWVWSERSCSDKDEDVLP